MYVAGKKEARRDKVYMLWCSSIPRLQDKELLDFETFYERSTGANIDTRPVEVIMAEIDEAMRGLEHGE